MKVKIIYLPNKKELRNVCRYPIFNKINKYLYFLIKKGILLHAEVIERASDNTRCA